MKSKIIISLATMATVLGITACVSANEEKDKDISMDQVPQAARDTLKQYASESDVKKVEKSDEDGVEAYEFDITQGTRSYELAITPEGKFNGTEEDVQLSDMPEAAQAALKAQAGDEGKLSEFEKAVDKNNKTTYEADVKKEDKKFEVAVDANGTVVSKENISSEKDEKGD